MIRQWKFLIGWKMKNSTETLYKKIHPRDVIKAQNDHRFHNFIEELHLHKIPPHKYKKYVIITVEGDTLVISTHKDDKSYKDVNKIYLKKEDLINQKSEILEEHNIENPIYFQRIVERKQLHFYIIKKIAEMYYNSRKF